eukprot:1511056-Prymnesium_polylepis.1
MGDKFYGAVAVGNLVVFAPSDADEVGLYDVMTRTFDASTSTGIASVSERFTGAVAVGNVVVFAPFNADAVG